MPTTDRWVAVDDALSGINYIGDSWFADVGGQDGTDNGPPFLSTLHGTNASASLAFNFAGSAVVVMGTNRIRNDSGVVDPQWSCYVDGASIYAVPPSPYPENNWGLCSSYSLQDGPHTITVNTTVARSQTFWLDRIDYLPARGASLANKTVVLTSADPAIRYGSNGWTAYADIGNMTQTQDASLGLDFYGTSLSWYGDIPSEFSGDSTTATWVIDQNPAQTFALKGHGTNATTAYNQKFFETPVYPYGPHRLTVTYNGDRSKTPLVLDKLFLQNDTSPPSATGAHRTTTSRHTPAIVGGAIGGVACLLVALLVALLAFFVLRRRRRRSEKEMRIMVDEPAEFVPAPQAIPPTRFPAKMSEERARAANTLSPGPTSPGPSGLLPPAESTPHLTATTDDDDERHSSGSRVSGSTGAEVARPSRLVVHKDSGGRLPPVPLVDIPPAYTPD